MIDSELRDSLLDRLREFPTDLRDQIDGVDEGRLCRAGPGGGWGPIEIFCHLRDWDEIYRTRVERIAAGSLPTITSVDDALWPIQREYHRQDPGAVLAEFAGRRAALVTFLDGLEPPAWQLLGVHFEQGRRSLTWFVEEIAEHDAEHLEQLRAALA